MEEETHKPTAVSMWYGGQKFKQKYSVISKER